MNENNKSIGVFDSGLGGLTVLKELKKHMPNESFIYFGDTAHLPYGNKSKQSIIEYSQYIANFLYSKNIKALVVACNSASAVVLNVLEKKYSIPILNVIDPSIYHAVNHSDAQSIGIIGTETTINSNTYNKKIHYIDSAIKVVNQACPLFVPIIEEGLINNSFTMEIANYYLKKINASNIDTLILGCTHYPVMQNVFNKVINKDIYIINSAEATAKYVNQYLLNQNLTIKLKSNNSDQYYVSDKPEKFDKLANMFLGITNINVEHVPFI
mgnify:CR=1 FL=1|tara:strand:- start:90 stop:896 length:807 start_codon:yes stop_codon:yes gene_type:complete